MMLNLLLLLNLGILLKMIPPAKPDATSKTEATPKPVPSL